MAIFYDYTITVNGNVSSLNKNIYLYRKNKNIDYYFSIKDASFKFTERQNENIVETANASYATIKILNPNGKRIMTNKASIVNGKVHFRITEALINEVTEVGVYVFQIDLYDDEDGRVTIPPVINALYVLEPLFDDDEVDAEEASNEVGIAQVNVSWVEGQEILDTFDENGKYLKTYWQEGDILTSGKLNKIEDALYNLSTTGGGGGGATSGYISTTSADSFLLSLNEDLNIDVDFSSPNIGRGTLKVIINDVEAKSVSVQQGENTIIIEGNLFTKGDNKLVIYALDRTGVMTNELTFSVRYGSTEITSTFDSSLAYDYGSVVRYYFTPSAVDTSASLKFYMKIDDVIQEGIDCTSDTRGYYTFPNDLIVGSHYCECWIMENDTTKSNVLAFNLVILDDTSLVINSTTKTKTEEEGNQLILDYRVYMKNNNTFNVKYYVDDELINTSTCTNAISYWTISTLTEGTHTLKVVASDITDTVSDYVTWTVNITPSTYEMKTAITTGSVALFTAKDRNNSDETRETWTGTNQDGEEITATLNNFAFNSESGWIDNSLIISGDSYVEIPIAPLANNAKYGFTLDIEFLSKMIGVEDAEVLTLWNDTDNCGIKITTEQLIIRSKKGNECRLYFSDNEKVNAVFTIDRNEKVCKIDINGVSCEFFHLSDYTADGKTYLEDFTVDSNIILGGKGKNGYCQIRNLRVYEVALTSEERMNNFLSLILDKTAQRQMLDFQTGNSLPTLTVTADFAGIGKDDKKPCDVVFMSPDASLYGQSFTLSGKNSTIQYQGTSSMAYPIKNYKLKFKDKDGNKFKFKIIGDGQPESTITMKADFMSSGHWQNTGLAKWISDHLYHYDSKDEKSMNPMKWWSLQNGGSLSDTRETINGFPCRLILVNDGTGTLNEGQAEPTSGNTKDMGIFNFNLDKGCTDSFGLDNEIFPRCVSYEVSANSDTSAGAFISFVKKYELGIYGGNLNNASVQITNIGYEEDDVITITNLTGAKNNFQLYVDGKFSVAHTLENNESIDIDFSAYDSRVLLSFSGYDKSWKIGDCLITSKEGLAGGTLNLIDDDELGYLQSSFELRYPDEEDVGADYGYLGMTVDGTFSQDYGLKRVIDFTDKSSDEEFVANFEQYFNKQYTFRYYLLVMGLAMVDNLGKNMMLDSWNGQIWYPRFYDLDRRKMSK